MRFFVHSAALLRQLLPHVGASHVRLRIRRGFCELWSEEATTALPIEGSHELECEVALDPLLYILGHIDEQPLTLDLHAHGGHRLYAARLTDSIEGFERIDFPLP